MQSYLALPSLSVAYHRSMDCDFTYNSCMWKYITSDKGQKQVIAEVRHGTNINTEPFADHTTGSTKTGNSGP